MYGADEFFPMNNARVVFIKTSYRDLPGWGDDNYREALESFLESCSRFLSRRDDRPVVHQFGEKIKNTDFYSVCKIGDVVRNYPDDLIKVFFEMYFVPYRVVDRGSTKSLFTGYYVPEILAKKTRDRTFKYPIYRKPPDVISGIKYYTREEIHYGALSNRNLEILYTNDPVELYFMHIQGSGIAKLVDENKYVNIGYDGKNNRSYSSLANQTKYNVDPAYSKKFGANSKALKRELKKDLTEAVRLFNSNESYVFFKFLNDRNFKGAFGTRLIPFRTVAVDNKYIPLGFPLWLSTKHTKEKSVKEFNRLVFANDVGSAVKGVNRGDIFFGFGRDGEDNSSAQHAEGQYFLLVPVKIAKKL